jgi:dienelactone hydrolase
MQKRQRICQITLIAFLLLLMYPVSNLAQTPSLWGELKSGPYAVGFKTVEKYDHSRVFRDKKDYFGNPLSGERARPIQICIWYPAKITDEVSEMTYGEYVFPYPEDNHFFDLISELQNREIYYLHYITGNDRGFVVDLMSARMAAFRNAPPADGSFPLIIYHPNLRRSYCENALICEYLASHGFVVATTHSLGMSSLNPQDNPANLEAQIRDREFAISCLHDYPNVDHNKMGVLGFSQGGLAALLMQMRNTDIDAVVSLEGWFIIDERIEFASLFSSYNVDRMNAPLLQICGQDEELYDYSLYNSLKYSDRFSLTISDFRGADFTHYSMFTTLASDSISSLTVPKRRGYEIICRYVLNFFKARLNSDEKALVFINNSPQDNDIEPGLFVISSFPGNDLPPTEEQFASIIEEHGIDMAVELYDKFKKSDPEHIFFREVAFNVLGYQYLQTGRISEAIAIFKMNADAYPHSANTWDSLAEAYMANGSNELAIKYYKKALETLPSDTTTSEQLKEAIRNGAQQNIERLGE